MESFVAGTVAGYGAAIPVGAAAILIIQTGIRSGFPPAASAGAGAATADSPTQRWRSPGAPQSRERSAGSRTRFATRVLQFWPQSQLPPWRPSAAPALPTVPIP